MRISVFGLGYVGTVSAPCFAGDGHDVIGVDLAGAKVNLLNRGEPPVAEVDLDEMIASAAAAGRLRATTDTIGAICETELSFVCVGTPSQPNGNLDLSFVRHVCEQIGDCLRRKNARHIVVVRSTILLRSSQAVCATSLFQS